MGIRLRHIAVAAALAVALLFASCDKRSPTSPVPPTQPGPSALPVVRVELVAPSEIAPGESKQLTLNAVRSDGSVENVTSNATWTPSTSPVLQVSSTGLVTGKARGEAFVRGNFGNRSASARIFVLPTGTFRLGGTIRESGFGIENVRLTVISGIEEGLTATSDLNGNYALYGVSGSVRIQTNKDGYLSGLHEVTVTAHRTADFEIVAARPRSDYRGTYTLTIRAGSPCRFSFGTLPEDAKRRVYTANVAQEGPRLTVTLADANFIVTNGHGNSFVGFADTVDGIRFTISDAYYYYYSYSGHFDIVESFESTALLILGTASVKGTPAVMSGMMSGSILISRNLSVPFRSFSSSCYAETHAFDMVRR